MKLGDLSKSSFALLVGALTLTVLVPGCGDDDDEVPAVNGGGAGKGGGGGAGGKGGATGQGGATSTMGGAKTSGGTTSSQGGSEPSGGTTTTSGGTTVSLGGSTQVEAGAGGGGGETGGYGGEIMAGAGGDTSGGTTSGGTTGTGGGGGVSGGGTTAGGTTGTGGTTATGGATAEGGTDVGPEAGAGGGGPAPLTCSDGCANLYVPFTAANGNTFFNLDVTDLDLTGKTVSFRVRTRGFTGTSGYVNVAATDTTNFSFYNVGSAAVGLTALGEFTTITLPFTGTPPTDFDFAHVLYLKIQINIGDGAIVPVNLEVDEISISDGGTVYGFTENANGVSVDGYQPVADSAVSYIPGGG